LLSYKKKIRQLIKAKLLSYLTKALQATVHCQNPGRTEVIQHLGAIRHRFPVDE